MPAAAFVLRLLSTRGDVGCSLSFASSAAAAEEESRAAGVEELATRAVRGKEEREDGTVPRVVSECAREAVKWGGETGAGESRRGWGGEDEGAARREVSVAWTGGDVLSDAGCLGVGLLAAAHVLPPFLVRNNGNADSRVPLGIREKREFVPTIPLPVLSSPPSHGQSAPKPSSPTRRQPPPRNHAFDTGGARCPVFRSPRSSSAATGGSRFRAVGMRDKSRQRENCRQNRWEGGGSERTRHHQEEKVKGRQPPTRVVRFINTSLRGNALRGLHGAPGGSGGRLLTGVTSCFITSHTCHAVDAGARRAP